MQQDYNLAEAYHLDESKIPELRERLKRKMWKVLLPVFIGLISLDILLNPLDIIQLSFLTVTMMILFMTITNSTVKKIINKYRDHRILINDKRITSIYQIEKAIEWEHARMKVKDSGEIIIVNTKFSWIKRFYDERGTIIILPELENYEKLKLVLFKKAKAG